jgi:hypothetical protein
MSLFAAALFSLASTAAPPVQPPPAAAAAPAQVEDQDLQEEMAEDDAYATVLRPHIQVLQHPYDISSFYRSSQTDSLGYGPEEQETSHYPIASFYRARGGMGSYSNFWTTGYGNAQSSQGAGRGARRGTGFMGSARPRPLGLNGDLCLFAPTFLAPVGPLTGVFFDK